MAVGPCVTDTDCIALGMDGPNLAASLILDPDTDNMASCGPNGLLVNRRRSRFVEDLSFTLIGVAGVSAVPAGMVVDVDAFAAGNANGTPIDVTAVSIISYTNTTGLSELCEFGFELGQQTYRLRGGWNVVAGLNIAWSGPSGLTPTFAFRPFAGFYTGANVFAQGVSDNPVYPLGVTLPPYWLRRWCIILPGETLTLQHRVWVQYEDVGLPSSGGSVPDNQISILAGPYAYLQTWTRG